MSGNEIYLLIKYIKSVLWGIAKRLSYIEDARCLKVNFTDFEMYIKRPLCLIIPATARRQQTCNIHQGFE